MYLRLETYKTYIIVINLILKHIFSLQVVTLLCLLNAASVLSLPTVLPKGDFPNAGIQSENTTEPVVVPKARAESEGTDKPVLLIGAVESDDADEPVVLEVDDIDVAEILVFRPSYKYWHNCIERRHKKAHREYAERQ
jgi:hypothetical protein